MAASGETLEHATAALQAQEKLCLTLKSNDRSSCQWMSSQNAPATTRALSILDEMREIKGVLEGTAVAFPAVTLNENKLQTLKQLILMHVPSSLTRQIKTQLTDLIKDLFEGQVAEVLFGGLLTCPWYMSTQDDRGLQAKFNTIFIVYASKHQHFLAPVNPHDKEKHSEIIDIGWLCAVEAYHFAHSLVGGKSRCVEALLMPEPAVFHADDKWNQLKTNLNPTLVTSLRGFLEQTRGQAVGGVGKKSKSGRMKVNDHATLHDFCDSFRLLHHTSRSLGHQSLRLLANDLSNISGSDHEALASEALTKLKLAFSESDGVRKEELFKLVMDWRRHIDEKFSSMKKAQFTSPASVEEVVSGWLLSVRTHNVTLLTDTALSCDVSSEVSELLRETGVAQKISHPEDVLLLARAGSALYGLSTPQSDIDYVIIYREPTAKVLGSCHRLAECFECRGVDKQVEYGAYEARLLAEMLWKCSIVILELVFAEKLDYTSKLWKELQSNKKLFVTEKAILQYFGLIKNNMIMIDKGKHKGTARERKLFYQIFHKLYCLEFFLRSEAPVIRCEGSTRDFIMRIRRGPLEGDLSRDKLYSLATDKLHSTKKALSERTQRLPENVDYNFLSQWLLRVRGWPISPIN